MEALGSVAMIALVLIGGCGLRNTTEQVVFAPQVAVTPINIGAGARVYLAVIDERSEKTLGRTKIYDIGYHTTEGSGDLSLVLHDSLRSGLQSLGFEVLTYPEASPVGIRIHLQSLFYNFRNENAIYFDIVPFELAAAAEAEIHKGQTRVFQRMYNVSVSQIPSLFTRRWREEKINDALSSLIGKMLADLELLAALKSGALP
jgi:hypothetical protein